MLAAGAGVAVDLHRGEDADDDGHDAAGPSPVPGTIQCGRRSRTSSSPSFSMLPGEGHAAQRTRRPVARCGMRSAPAELVQPVVVDAEVVADLVDDGDAHLAPTTSSSVRQAARIGPPVDRDAVGHRHEPVGLVPLGERARPRRGPSRSRRRPSSTMTTTLSIRRASSSGSRRGRPPPAPRTAPRRPPAPASRSPASRSDRSGAGVAGFGYSPASTRPAPVTADPGNPLCILAGAGSGKTRVLTRRIAYRAATGAPIPATSWPSPSPARPPASSPPGSRALGLRDRPTAGTFHAVAYAQLRSLGPTEGRAPPVLLDRKARLLGPHPRAHEPHDRRPSSPPRSSGPRPAWSAPTATPTAAAVADRRTGRRPPTGSPRSTAATRRRSDSAGSSTSTTSSPTAPTRHRRPTAPSPPPSAGGSATCSSTSSRTSTRSSTACCTCWLGDRDDLCVVGDPNQAIYGWNGADAGVPHRLHRPPPGGRGRRARRQLPLDAADPAVAAAVLDRERARPLHRAPADGRGARPSSRTRPTPTRRAASPEPCATTTTRPGAWGRQAVLVRTNAQTHARRGGARPGPHPLPAARRDAVPHPPDVRRGARDRSPAPPAALAVALAELAAETPRGDDLTDRQRETAAPPRRRSCSSASEFLTLEPAGSVADLRRWLDSDRPARRRARGRATPSRSSRSTPPRASSGRWSTSPAWRTATSRSATPAAPRPRPRSAGCSTSR